MRKFRHLYNNLDYKWFRIFLVFNGLAMCIAYPTAMIFVEKVGWIWDVPSRNLAMEHMLVAIYVTMGLFLIYSARRPIQSIQFVNFVIVSGFIHATAMLIDSIRIPGEHEHLMLGGNVVGTYLAPITLLLSHPYIYSFFTTKTPPASETYSET